LADTFCYRYSAYCDKEFGFVPNHSADKVTLVGADATVQYGEYVINEPIGAYLFGKVTRSVGVVAIPVEELFDAAVDDVLSTCTKDPEIVGHIAKFVRSVIGYPLDHSPGYYSPASAEQLGSILATEWVSNDTVACAASAPFTPVEALTLAVEEYIRSPEFLQAGLGTGHDVKVLTTRCGSRLDVAMCLPFHPRAVTSWELYVEALAAARLLITGFIDSQKITTVDNVDLHLNGRDVLGRGYLAPFGTCLGKGDSGAVGRGNRFNGIITPGRAMSIEAPAGKNLVHHTGRLYTVLAQWIADAIKDKYGANNEVVITTRVGNRLDQPATVWINLAGEADPAAVTELARHYVRDVSDVTNALLVRDPLAELAKPLSLLRG
jgi:S-adenosylmethionine synthetase